MIATDLPPWLTHDGTEDGITRVLNRIVGRERRLRATAVKPDRGPNISRLKPLPPAHIRWSREAWEAAHPAKFGVAPTEWFQWGDLYLTAAQVAMLRNAGAVLPALRRLEEGA